MTLSTICNSLTLCLIVHADKYIIIVKFSLKFDGIHIPIYLLNKYVSGTVLAAGL